MNKTVKILSILTALAVIVCFSAIPASAVLLGKDGFYYEFDGDNAVLKEYHSGNTNVEIPSEVYSHSVTVISDYTFLRNTGIVSVNVPNTVTTIGNSAFYGCSNLETITIPQSVTVFGNSVFANCDKLTIECFKDSAAAEYARNNNINFSLIDGSALVNLSEIDVNRISKGESVTVTALAEGGSEVYSYEFFYKKNADTQWVEFSRDNINGNTASAAFDEAGTYNIKVNITDDTGISKYKLFEVTVTDDNPSGISYTYGDVDMDNVITSADSLSILRRSVLLDTFTDTQEILSDVDLDGTITSADALAVLRYSVKLSGNTIVGETVELQ